MLNRCYEWLGSTTLDMTPRKKERDKRYQHKESHRNTIFKGVGECVVKRTFI